MCGRSPAAPVGLRRPRRQRAAVSESGRAGGLQPCRTGPHRARARPEAPLQWRRQGFVAVVRVGLRPRGRDRRALSGRRRCAHGRARRAGPQGHGGLDAARARSPRTRSRQSGRDRARAVRLGMTLRSLGRAEESVALLEAAVAWAEESGTPDAWFHEELAEDYAAVGRTDEARTQAELALKLIDGDAEPNRAARLQTLVAG